MKMTHHLRDHHRTQTLSPAASRRGTSRTAYVPRLDRLEGRIALNANVNFDPSTDQLTVVTDENTTEIDVRAVKPAGAATGLITVTYDGQTKQFSTDNLASVLVQSPSSNNTVLVDIEGFTPSTVSVQQGSTDTGNQTAAQFASVSQTVILG